MVHRYSGVFITNSFEETQRLGEKFAKDILKRHPSGVVLIALHGELGSGKTTFVQGLAKGLGITRIIISPTFIIIRSYKIKYKKLNIKNTYKKLEMFYHIDLYRIKNEKDIEGLGIDEIINNPENIVAIEWAEKMGRFLPSKTIHIRFACLSENKRRITIDIKD